MEIICSKFCNKELDASEPTRKVKSRSGSVMKDTEEIDRDIEYVFDRYFRDSCEDDESKITDVVLDDK